MSLAFWPPMPLLWTITLRPARLADNERRSHASEVRSGPLAPTPSVDEEPIATTTNGSARADGAATARRSPATIASGKESHAIPAAEASPPRRTKDNSAKAANPAWKGIDGLKRLYTGIIPFRSWVEISPVKVRDRNLYVDLFRGFALISIYIDHIPNNPLAYFTINRYGFSNAAEVFVFLAGYAAAKAFGRAIEANPLLGAMHVLQRCWTLYIVHIFLFVLFIAQVSWSAEQFQNPLLAEEMRITSILDSPYIAVTRALALMFQPAFLDILPLYIMLLLAFTPVFLLLRWNAGACLLLSFAVWLFVQVVGVRVPAYPTGVWLFNPLAWQFVFIIGMAVGWDGKWKPNYWNPVIFALTSTLAAIGFSLRNGMEIAAHYDRVPDWLASVIWPLADKSNLALVPLLNFLALAHVCAWIVRKLPQPTSGWLKPFVLCGQNSLYVFCIGLVLSFFGHLVLVEFDNSWGTLLILNGGGIAIMFGAAWIFDWYKTQQRGSRNPHPRSGP